MFQSPAGLIRPAGTRPRNDCETGRDTFDEFPPQRIPTAVVRYDEAIGVEVASAGEEAREASFLKITEKE